MKKIFLLLAAFSLVSCGDSYYRNKIRNLEKIRDSLENEIAIRKGMDKDVKGSSLEDKVFYISGNQSVYHTIPDCHGVVMESGKIKSETLEKAIDEGKIPCSICTGKLMPMVNGENSDNSVSGETVFICSGSTSKRYHSDPDCRGLSNCTGEIEEVSEEEAEDMGRTPCQICY